MDTQFDLTIDEMSKRSFKQKPFRIWPAKRPNSREDLFFLRQNAVQGTALSPITSLPPTDLSGFLWWQLLSKGGASVLPCRAVKNPLPEIRLNKQQDPFCPFLSASCIEMCPGFDALTRFEKTLQGWAPSRSLIVTCMEFFHPYKMVGTHLVGHAGWFHTRVLLHPKNK